MKNARVLHNKNGAIKFFFVIAILAFTIYAGLKFGMPYYKYLAFKSDVKEIIRISIGDTENTRAQIFERAQELKLPLEEKDIMVTKTEKTVRVRTSWSETADIFGVYQKKFGFAVDVEG